MWIGFLSLSRSCQFVVAELYMTGFMPRRRILHKRVNGLITPKLQSSWEQINITELFNIRQE
jgi:hypothetical protein